MKRLLDLIGMSALGWAGWALGSNISVFTAFLLGMVGTGMGLYLTRRFTRGIRP